MKASKLIEMIKNLHLEDFDIQFGAEHNGDWEKFEVTGICDVGYSDKTIMLESKEID